MDERHGHAHRSPETLSAKASNGQVRFPIEESNPRPIDNCNDSGALNHSSVVSYELSQCPFISIYEFHYFAMPVQNEGLLRLVDERHGHAHHSSKPSSIKASNDQVKFPTEESNPRLIDNPNDSGVLEISTVINYELSLCPFISVYEFHYFALPIQNEELLRHLYLEMDFSSYQISEISGWSRTSISDALRELDIKKNTRKGPLPQYGMKKEGTTHVVHKGEQKIIGKMLSFRNSGLSFDAIANKLNEENTPSKSGGQWNKSTVKDIIKREQKKKV